MGVKSAEALDVSFDELPNYLHAKHSVYMEVGGATYYLTDVNDRYWRAQDTAQFNDKGHYVDASELVPTVSEFMTLPFVDGKSQHRVHRGEPEAGDPSFGARRLDGCGNELGEGLLGQRPLGNGRYRGRPHLARRA